MPRLLPKKRLLRVLLALIVLLLATWLIAPRVLVPRLRTKLQAMISSQLDAELAIDDLSYFPPYGVRAHGVSLVATDPKHGRVEVLKIGALDLKLAKLPIGRGPLVIENIMVRDPEVHIVLADGAVVGRGHLVRRDGRPKFSDKILAPGTKLSDMFLLRHFGVSGGAVVIENRDRRGTPPMVWRALDAQMQTVPRSKSAYDFRLDTDPNAPADLRIAGAFDLDALWVELSQFQLNVDANTAGQAALPAQVQSVLQQYRIAGKVTLEASGRAMLRDLSRTHFAGSLTLKDGSAFVPQRGAAVEKVAAKVTFARAPKEVGGKAANPDASTVVKLESLQAESDGSRLSMSGATATLNAAKRAWSVKDVNGELRLGDPAAVAASTASVGATTTPAATRRSLFQPLGTAGRVTFSLGGQGRIGAPLAAGGFDVDGSSLAIGVEGVTVQLPRSGVPLRDLTATLRKEAGSDAIVLSRASASHGNDRLRVDRARLTLPDDPRDLLDGFRVEEISGALDFRSPRTPYPGGFGKAVERLAPTGIFDVGGGSWIGVAKREPKPPGGMAGAAPPSAPAATQADAVPRRRIDYFISVSADRARFDLLDGRLPLTDVHGDATLSRSAVDVERVRGGALGGTFAGAFHVAPGAHGSYKGEVSGRDVSLKRVAEAFQMPQKQREKLDGKGFLNAAFSGDLPPAGKSWTDSLHADGEFEVIGSSFWRLPVLGHLAETVKLADQLTVGEAAGRFEVKDRVLVLQRAAVQSPALGLLGSGTIGFDKSLDLRVTAAPLGDWRDRIKQGRIPIVSDVAAEVVGGVQQVLKLATSKLLFEFRVRGTLSEPKVEAIPAPILTEPAALLLGTMLREGEGQGRRKWAEMAKKMP